MKNIKRYIVIILVIFTLTFAFAACTGNGKSVEFSTDTFIKSYDYKDVIIYYVDENGTPIPNIKASLCRASDNFVVFTKLSSLDGKMTFNRVSNGAYYIAIVSVPEGYTVVSNSSIFDLETINAGTAQFQMTLHSHTHRFSDWKRIKEATCLEEGKEVRVCEDCGYKEDKVLKKISHVFNEYEIEKQPTCSERGIKTAMCIVCGTTVKDYIDCLPHSDDNNFVVVKAATENSSGKRATHCLICGEEVQTESYSLTLEEKNALKSARSYIKYSAFSRTGLIKQLEYEGYSKDAAILAVDTLNVDWKEQAAKCAKEYMDFSSFSKSGLIKQLKYEGFTEEEAEYGVKAVGY